MQVAERQIDDVVQDLDEVDEAAAVSWFAARQPGIVRFLAARLGERGDAMSVGLYYACAIHAAFEHALGLPPPRVLGSLLERAERAFVDETLAGRSVADGLVQRQPALAMLIAGVVDAPPLPLMDDEATGLGIALAAVTYALDEMASGRQVP
jgi:hypothetical protein